MRFDTSCLRIQHRQAYGVRGVFIALVQLVAIVGAALIPACGPSAPRPKPGQCLLVRRAISPDFCDNICSPPFNCTVTTRPYLIVFTQSATCANAVICPSAPR